MLTDVHCHIHHCYFDKDRDNVISRAKEAGVKVIINNGLNPSSNRKTLEMCEKYKEYNILKAALGIYPTEILQDELKKKGWNYEEFDVLEELEFIKKNKNKIIAIGEIGLDDHHFKGTLEVQEKLFRKQLELAEKIKKPVIIHSRDAESKVIEILKDYKLKVVMHSFGSSDKKLIKRAVDYGYYFSIPVSVVRNKGFQDLVSEISMSRILTETDSPYLGLKHGERNEPCNVQYSIKKIAEIKDLTVEEMQNIVYGNYKRVFEME